MLVYSFSSRQFQIQSNADWPAVFLGACTGLSKLYCDAFAFAFGMRMKNGKGMKNKLNKRFLAACELFAKSDTCPLLKSRGRQKSFWISNAFSNFTIGSYTLMSPCILAGLSSSLVAGIYL